jgi:hypothetical protein
MEDLLCYDRFAMEQGGTYTAQMVAAFLKLTLQGVDYAARTGGIKFVNYGRNRFFGKKSVIDYRWSLSRKFKDNPRLSFSPGQVNPPRTPDMLQPSDGGPPADFIPSRHPGDIRRENGLVRRSSDSSPQDPAR